jgi:hypothetical protein
MEITAFPRFSCSVLSHAGRLPPSYSQNCQSPHATQSEIDATDVRRPFVGSRFLDGLGRVLRCGCCPISRKRAELTQRIVEEYPDPFSGGLVQVHIYNRQRKRSGEPFELYFNDAISGRGKLETLLSRLLKMSQASSP